MQNGTIDCRRARDAMAAYLAGRAPEIEEHLAHCEECAGLLADALLREPAGVQVPAGFAARVAARARTLPPDPENVLPAVIVAATLLFSALAAWTLWTGAGTRWLAGAESRYAFWLAIGTAEAAGSLVFLWHAARAS